MLYELLSLHLGPSRPCPPQAKGEHYVPCALTVPLQPQGKALASENERGNIRIRLPLACTCFGSLKALPSRAFLQTTFTPF